MLRDCLYELGMVPCHQSVFIHPGECRGAVREVAAALNLEKRILFFETDSVDGERDLKKFFPKKL